MKQRLVNRGWLSSIVYYLLLIWTLVCTAGTGYVIFRYDIHLRGLIGIVVTLFFGAAAWVIPFSLLMLLSLFISPPEESPPCVMFKELMKNGMKRNPHPFGRNDLGPANAGVLK